MSQRDDDELLEQVQGQEGQEDNAFLEMSDEEYMNMAQSSLASGAEGSTNEDTTQQTPAGAADTDTAGAADAGSGQGADAGAAVGTAEDPAAAADGTGAAEPGQATGEAAGADAGVTKEPAAAPADAGAESGAVDYKAAYEKILKPFKANGREIAVKSVDDAITLMQMGANYNKKMSALKPNLKLLKMLENNGLLSEDKIGFLIDLDKRNPDAINKLVKDSGLDPMDLDADKAGAYKPTTYKVDDREMALDDVLDSIQESPTYNRTLDTVAKKWDAKSKQVIADSPKLLQVIDDHMQSGIYDVISAEIERERLFGRLDGLSDIEAYRQIGDALHARGGFNHLVSGSSQTQGQSQPAPHVNTPPKPKQVDDDKLKDQRRAASSTKPAAAPGARVSTDFNPLNMSDEEFSKHVHKQFL